MSNEPGQLTQHAGSWSQQGGKGFSPSHTCLIPSPGQLQMLQSMGLSPLCGKQYLLPLPHTPSVFCFLLLHLEPPKITLAIVPDISHCELIVCYTLPFNLPRPLCFQSIPSPYFCYDCLPMSRSNLHPAWLWEQRRTAAQAWGNGRALELCL